MRKFSLLFSLLLVIYTLAKAQDNTPYARYGIGELSDQNFSAMRGMGDVSAAHNSPNALNFSNPASLAFLRYTVFDIGGNISDSWLKTAGSSSTFGSGDPDYIALGFPISRKKIRIGGGFGLSQFSSANYQVVQYQDSTLPLGADKNTYTGTGGINQLYFALGAGYTRMVEDSGILREHGSFAIGVKAAFLFGNINYINTLQFVDTSNGYNTQVIQTRRVAGILFSGGAQYKVSMGQKKNYHLTFGVDGNLTSHVTARQDLLYERYRTNTVTIDSPSIYDTVLNVSGQKGYLVIPMQVDGGITFSKDNNYSFGAQFHYGKWSEYRSFGVADSTTNNWKASIGGEWTPNFKSEDSYFERMTYRAGVYYGTNYLKFSGLDFVNYGITLGAAFPVRKSLSTINISFNIGKLGNVADNGEREVYFMTTVGFSLSDLWFLKRKYD